MPKNDFLYEILLEPANTGSKTLFWIDKKGMTKLKSIVVIPKLWSGYYLCLNMRIFTSYHIQSGCWGQIKSMTMQKQNIICVWKWDGIKLQESKKVKLSRGTKEKYPIFVKDYMLLYIISFLKSLLKAHKLTPWPSLTTSKSSQIIEELLYIIQWEASIFEVNPIND